MPELSTLGGVIKVAYESQANTNAFTDTEKSKLSALPNPVPNASLKVWLGTVTSTNEGLWSVDYSSAGFTTAPSVFAMGVATEVNNCTFVSVSSISTTAASGYTKDSTSAGVLLAMEMLDATSRTIHILAISK